MNLKTKNIGRTERQKIKSLFSKKEESKDSFLIKKIERQIDRREHKIKY